MNIHFFKTKKQSLRIKLTICLIIMMAATVLCCWILNRTMMESYFVKSERMHITKTYDRIEEQLAKKGSISVVELEKLADKNNLKIMIGRNSDHVLSNGDVDIIYSSTGQAGRMYVRMYQLIEKAQESVVFGSQSKTGQEIKLQGYTIIKQSDPKLGSTSISLLGVIAERYYIVIDSSMESLQTAAGIATRFMAYAGILVTILVSFFTYWFSQRFTKPIEDMSEIAKRMAQLDFDARMTELSQDEVGQLGESINCLSEQLEHTISELKTANAKLQKDIEHKIQIDEMRKEFLSHVSHELKTPIALIQGYAEGLADNINEDQESREFYCDVIVDEAQKMNQLVQKLMTLNQIEFGQNQMDIQRFDLGELTGNLLQQSELRFAKKHVTIENEMPQDFHVWGDAFLIEDVLNNYISNAYHHVMDHGRIRIWKEEIGQNVRIWVFNDGKPIPEDELEKIWIRFYKVDKARTREYGGSGVGLSIVAAIMDAHGKKYGVKNIANGPAFYFELERA